MNIIHPVINPIINDITVTIKIFLKFKIFYYLYDSYSSLFSRHNVLKLDIYPKSIKLLYVVSFDLLLDLNVLSFIS